jgi:hypothetical protein
MPGLLRGIARTAVVAGTATAVAGGVHRRQQRRWAAQDQQAYAPPPQPAYAAPPATAPAAPPDPLAQLKELGELHAQGVLTDEEFAAEKAKILNS